MRSSDALRPRSATRGLKIEAVNPDASVSSVNGVGAKNPCPPERRLVQPCQRNNAGLAQLFQSDIGRVKVGDLATVTVDSYPGQTFPARVSFIWPAVDQTTRTTRVRLEIPNPEIKLSLGMFVNVLLGSPLGRQLVIPASGVFQSGARQIAFVDHGEGYFEPRDIEVGPRVGDDFIVLKGL